MKKGYILAYDLGTTGNKATLYDSTGRLLARSFQSYVTNYPRVNWAEQDPLDWWKAVCISTEDLLKKARISNKDVTCVSFSGQMMGCLPLDKQGNPLRNSIIWADQRGVEQANRIRETVGEDEVYTITGHRISPTYSAAKIMWLRDNEPEIFKKVYKFVQAKDYIIHRLTGRFVTDYSDASGMNLFDLQKKEWSSRMLKATGVPLEILPELHTSVDVIGGVTREISEEVFLRPDTPVVMGGGDGPCAAVGAGVVREGSSYNYLGSSSWIALASAKPVYDPEKRTFNFSHLDPGMFMPTGTMQTAGGAYQWLKDNLCGTETQAAREAKINPYQIMDLKAESVEPGAQNLLFLPYLMGERSPYWNPDAKGAFIGLTLTHKKEHLIRSVLEGIAFNLKIILDAFEEQGARIEEVRVIGGGARGRVLRQIMADVYGRKILSLLLVEEATSLGAAIAGGIGTGIFKDFRVAEKLVKIVEVHSPRPWAQKRYEKLYPIFKNAYKALGPIYEQIASLK